MFYLEVLLGGLLKCERDLQSGEGEDADGTLRNGIAGCKTPAPRRLNVQPWPFSALGTGTVLLLIKREGPGKGSWQEE